jgi:aspartyl protease family protein
MKYFCVVALIILLDACEHPEHKRYERNQGHDQTSEQHGEDVSSSGITQIEMEVESGVRFVWIEINGLRLRFIFDTGASSLCISEAEATVLYRQGTLRDEDILNIEYFQDATGRVSEGMKINLREVKIADVTLENVEALVVGNRNAPLLLGQSVLERFGSISIDNNNNTITFQ